MADKQIDFPQLQKEAPWLAWFMVILSLVCIVVVVILLLADVHGPFIGPWG